MCGNKIKTEKKGFITKLNNKHNLLILTNM